MILYGWREKAVAQKRISELECEHCKERQSYAVGMIKYIHIFWLPFLSIGKKVKLYCNHCKKVTNHQNIDKETRDQYKRELFENYPFKNRIIYNILFIVFVLIFSYGLMV